MALFFDSTWFDGELGRLHLSRDDLGRMLGLSSAEIAELWKDQRELKPAEVALIAALFNRPPGIIADHAGISTRAPAGASSDPDRLADRLDALERKIDRILALLEETARRSGPH